MTGQTSAKQFRVIIADDHADVRDAVCDLLADEPDIEIVACVEDGDIAVQKGRELLPDVIVMDIRMPRLNGIEATRQIMSQQSGVRVLCMSVHHEKSVVDAMVDAGATGYIVKGEASAELARAIRAVGAGGTYFCPAVSGEAPDSSSTPRSQLGPDEPDAETA